jgi:signal transduction histidine kinase
MFTISVGATAQQQSTDSLEKLLAEKSDTARVNIMLILGQEYARTNPHAAESILQRSISLSDSMNYKEGLAMSYMQIGNLKIITGEYELAYSNLIRSISLFRELGDVHNTAQALLDLASISNRLADYPKALEYASNALILSRQTEDLQIMAMAYNLMGIVYDNMGNFKSALTNYQKSLEIFSSENDRVGMGKIYLNIAIIYNKTGRKQDAENLLFKCVSIGQEFNDARLLSIAYGNIGLLYNEDGSYNKALEYYQLSLDMKEKIGDKHSIMISYINIAGANFQLGESTLALKNLNIAIKIGTELGAKRELIDAYEMLAALYEQRNDFPNAYRARTQQMALNDSVFGQDQMKYLADVEKKNAINQLESENKILRQKSIIDRLKIENNRFIRYYLLIGLAFAIVLIGLLVYQSTERRKNSRRLDEANHQLVAINEQLKFSEGKLAESNMAKDQFFSIISHDLRNPLASMVSFVRIMKRDYDTLSMEERQSLIDEFEKIVNRTGNLLENLLMWSRSQTGRLSYNPSRFAAHFIIDENIDLHEASIKTKQIKIELVPESKQAEIFADINMLNTVIRNLMSNAVKFTPLGGTIEVGYRINGNDCIFFVKDSGIGIEKKQQEQLFDLGQAHIRTGTASEKGSGLGLVLCKDFVEKNKGRIWLESIPEKGTTFYFSVPLASGNET